MNRAIGHWVPSLSLLRRAKYAHFIAQRVEWIKGLQYNMRSSEPTILLKTYENMKDIESFPRLQTSRELSQNPLTVDLGPFAVLKKSIEIDVLHFVLHFEHPADSWSLCSTKLLRCQGCKNALPYAFADTEDEGVVDHMKIMKECVIWIIWQWLLARAAKLCTFHEFHGVFDFVAMRPLGPSRSFS